MSNNKTKTKSPEKVTKLSVLQHLLGYLSKEQWLDAKTNKMTGNNTYLVAYLTEKQWEDAVSVLQEEAYKHLVSFATDVDKTYITTFKSVVQKEFFRRLMQNKKK